MISEDLRDIILEAIEGNSWFETRIEARIEKRIEARLEEQLEARLEKRESKKNTEIAKNMLSFGDSVDRVVETTGLPHDVVKSLV